MDLIERIQARREQGEPPLLFAHRGLRAKAPENSLPAFAAALDAGLEGVELDTLLSRDGQIVVLHDKVITVHTPRTRYVPVSRLTLAQLREIDAGAFFHESFRGTRIPTLQEVLEMTRGRLFVDIELKETGIRGRQLARLVGSAVLRAQVEREVLVTAFDPLALNALHTAAPDIPVGLLYRRRTPGELGIRFWSRVAGARFLMPEKGLISRPYVEWLRRRSQGVFSWVVDDTAQALQLTEIGVDAFVTDEAETLYRTLKGPSPRP